MGVYVRENLTKLDSLNEYSLLSVLPQESY